jgi:hypothetical protein
LLPIAVPIIISLAALMVSIFAYNIQHSAYEATSISNKEQYAKLVSGWLIVGDNQHPGGQVVVQNLGNAPINQVAVKVYGITTSGGWGLTATVYPGTIPLCTRATVTLNASNDLWMSYINSITFEDVNGLSWSRNFDGTLASVPAPLVLAQGIVGEPAMKLASVQGCQ